MLILPLPYNVMVKLTRKPMVDLHRERNSKNHAYLANDLELVEKHLSLRRIVARIDVVGTFAFSFSVIQVQRVPMEEPTP